jgi:hypothetical protein
VTMANLRLIREGLEAADDLSDLFRSILVEVSRKNPRKLERLEKILNEKRTLIHTALAEAVAAEKTTTRNRTCL